MRDSRLVTVTGDKAADGTCIWHPPALSSGPGDEAKAIESRQVSVNDANCTSVVEIGTPEDLSDEVEPGGQEITVTAESER